MFLSTIIGRPDHRVSPEYVPPECPPDLEFGFTELHPKKSNDEPISLAASSSSATAQTLTSTFSATPEQDIRAQTLSSSSSSSSSATLTLSSPPKTKPNSNADLKFPPRTGSNQLTVRHVNPTNVSPSRQVAVHMVSVQEVMKNPRKRYALIKRICHSIYGEVYLGVDQTTNRRVAIKVSVLTLLNKHESRNEVKVLEDPKHEAGMMKLVSGHRCIVQLVDTHEDENFHWLVQEYVPGGELFDLVVKYGHLPDEYARRFFQYLLSAMHHMHTRGVCHLDLSLENLLLDQEGYLKVCDFGLARTFEHGKLFPGSKDCKPGKLNYMAPEILAGKEFDGPKADLFSAGVILFTMLTGHPPFQAACHDDERYRLIASGQIGSLLLLLRMSDRVNAPARDLLTRLLHPDPAKRLTAEKIASHPWVRGLAST